MPESEMAERYRVKKEAGSMWAYAVDTKTGKILERFNVLKGQWDMADKYCARLNAKAHAGE